MLTERGNGMEYYNPACVINKVPGDRFQQKPKLRGTHVPRESATKPSAAFCQLPVAEFQLQNPASNWRHVHYGYKEIKQILEGACNKLELVERERYVMQQKARIEAYKKGISLADIEHVQWYDFSKCPKKYCHHQ